MFINFLNNLAISVDNKIVAFFVALNNYSIERGTPLFEPAEIITDVPCSDGRLAKTLFFWFLVVLVIFFLESYYMATKRLPSIKTFIRFLPGYFLKTLSLFLNLAINIVCFPFVFVKGLSDVVTIALCNHYSSELFVVYNSPSFINKKYYGALVKNNMKIPEGPDPVAEKIREFAYKIKGEIESRWQNTSKTDRE